MQSCSGEQVSGRFTFVPWNAPRRPAMAVGSRQMTPAQGRALETLAHAIEYLEDEAALTGNFLLGAKRSPQMEAIASLKAASRNLWASLPTREPLWRRWLHSHDHGTVVTLPMQ